MSSLLRARINLALPVALLGMVPVLCLSLPARAAANDVLPTPILVAQLELQANQASPREQAFLYTQLVHTMTQEAGRQIADGETEQAATTLKKVNRYAHLIHLNLAHNAKRLKDAQELMHNTTYRLAQVLHLVSGEDRTTVQDTLKQLNQVNDELLTEVFTH
jgi:hypothetical protein